MDTLRPKARPISDGPCPDSLRLMISNLTARDTRFLFFGIGAAAGGEFAGRLAITKILECVGTCVINNSVAETNARFLKQCKPRIPRCWLVRHTQMNFLNAICTGLCVTAQVHS